MIDPPEKELEDTKSTLTKIIEQLKSGTRTWITFI